MLPSPYIFEVMAASTPTSAASGLAHRDPRVQWLEQRRSIAQALRDDLNTWTSRYSRKMEHHGIALDSARVTFSVDMELSTSHLAHASTTLLTWLD